MEDVPGKLRDQVLDLWLAGYVEDRHSAQRLLEALPKMEISSDLKNRGIGRAVEFILNEDPAFGIDWLIKSSDSVYSVQNGLLAAVQQPSLLSNNEDFFDDLFEQIRSAVPSALEPVQVALATAMVAQEGIGSLQKVAPNIESERSWSLILRDAARNQRIAPSDLEELLPRIEQLSPFDQSQFFSTLIPFESDPERLRQFASILEDMPEHSQYRAGSKMMYQADSHGALRSRKTSSEEVAHLLNSVGNSPWLKLGIVEGLFGVGAAFTESEQLVKELIDIGDMRTADLVRRYQKKGSLYD